MDHLVLSCGERTHSDQTVVPRVRPARADRKQYPLVARQNLGETVRLLAAVPIEARENLGSIASAGDPEEARATVLREDETLCAPSHPAGISQQR